MRLVYNGQDVYDENHEIQSIKNTIGTGTLNTEAQTLIGGINEVNSSLTQKPNLVVLSTSIVSNYADSTGLGYRNTVANAIDITALQDYPTGKTILGIIPINPTPIYAINFSVDGTTLHCTSKTSGTWGCVLYVFYLD